MSRGPAPADKSPDRPTVPQVLELLRGYRRIDANRLSGGVVHVIVDDGNVEQYFADSCLTEAESSPEWDRPEDVEIARALAAMTPTQRRKVYATDTYPPVGEWPGLDIPAASGER